MEDKKENSLSVKDKTDKGLKIKRQKTQMMFLRPFISLIIDQRASINDVTLE